MTSDLIAFIEARLDEDEAAAYGLCGNGLLVRWIARGSFLFVGQASTPIAQAFNGRIKRYITRNDPARALKEIAFKRSIIARYQSEIQKPLHTPEPEVQELIDQRIDVLEDIMYEMAAIWSDHPDFKQVEAR